MPQVSPLMAPPQQYNPQIPPPYFHHYPPTSSPSVDSNESLLARVFHRQMDMAERQEKHDQETEEREKCREECEKHEKREANQRPHINKAFEKIEHFEWIKPQQMSSVARTNTCDVKQLQQRLSQGTAPQQWGQHYQDNPQHRHRCHTRTNKRYCIAQSFQLKNTFTKTLCFQFYPTETR